MWSFASPHCKWGGDSLWRWPNFRLSRARDVDRDLVSGHTAYHHDHSSTYTYIPNFIEIEETFCGTFETHFIKSTRRSRPKKDSGQCRRRPAVLRKFFFSLCTNLSSVNSFQLMQKYWANVTSWLLFSLAGWAPCRTCQSLEWFPPGLTELEKLFPLYSAM